MALWVPPSARDFGAVEGNVIGVRPAAAFGTSVTPGASNVKAATFTTLVAATTFDCCYAVINFNSNFVAVNIRNVLCDIGVGAVGSEQVFIPNLLVAGADSYIASGGVWYAFPIYIPSGSRIGARAQVNNATAGTFRCAIWLYGRPKDERMVRVGSRVIAYGVTTVSSNGTAVTPGTTGEGTWQQLGIVSATTHWWWQFGVGFADTTMNALGYHADLAVGDATNKDIVIDDCPIITGGNEQVSKDVGDYRCQREPGGTIVYGRMQCSGTADTGITMAAYGMS